MLIKIRHPRFSSVELRDGSLVIHSMQGKPRVLQENVVDVAVVVMGEVVRIVGFLNKTYAWYFSGAEDLQSERIEFEQLYGGGGQLINDGLGNSHLLYFAKQAVGHGAQLRHQILSDHWGIPQTVSINVFAERSSLSASWNSDGCLHLVYLGHSDQQLLYRVYNFEQRLWSGAVVFSEERCSYPQFIPAPERLYLFWQEEKEKTVLRVRHKEQHWSPIKRVSSGDRHVSGVGYYLQDGLWRVLWGDENGFFEATFDNWANPTSLKREDFEYTWVVEGMQTIPVYERKDEVREATLEAAPETQPEATPESVPVSDIKPKAEPEPEPVLEPEPEPEAEPEPEPVLEPELEPEPEPEPEPVAVLDPMREVEARPKEREQLKRESEEAKLQAAFVEQAFRTMQEWEKMKEEIARWKREFKRPEPVDLNPLVARIERLERRMLSLQQSQEQSKKLWDENTTQIEQSISRVKSRLRDLEEEKNAQPSFWQRVLGRG